MLEEANARMAFVELDRNGDRILTLKELQTFPAFDYDYDGIVSEKEAKFFLQMKEEVSLEDFLASGWKVLKHAYFMAKESPEDDDDDTDEIEFPTKFKNWDAKKKQKEQSKHLLPTEQKQKEKLDRKSVKTISENAEKTKQQLTNASQSLQKIKVQIREIEQDLNTDYGLEDEYFILKGQCFDFEKNEYSYKICPFQYVKQLSSGGFDVLLGLWGDWIGSNESRFSRLRYENGTKCWRGMNHVSFVYHHCGAINEVLWVSEANPCEYHFDFATPAMCATLPSHALEILGEISLGL